MIVGRSKELNKNRGTTHRARKRDKEMRERENGKEEKTNRKLNGTD